MWRMRRKFCLPGYVCCCRLLIPLHISEAKTNPPVPFFRCVIIELCHLYSDESMDITKYQESESKWRFLTQTGLKPVDLELLLSDWYKEKYHRATG